MKLGQKIKHLRYAEGILRGLGREITQAELLNAVREELGQTISQSYLSQIENGLRPHLTKRTRELLASFFKVHPGFLVDDPEGFHTELISSLPVPSRKLDRWLLQGAQQFSHDAELAAVLENLAQSEEARDLLILMGSILDTPGLALRLSQVLGPARSESRTDSESPSRGNSDPVSGEGAKGFTSHPQSETEKRG